MSNYDCNSDQYSFLNSGKEVNEIKIEDVILEFYNNETESVQNDQLEKNA